MQYDSNRVHHTVTLDSLSFEVVSYRLDHVKSVSSYYTVSNATGMYTSGVKPYALTLRGYFPKVSGNAVVSKLESLLAVGTEVTFSVSDMEFSHAVLSRYSFKEQVPSMYQECELTFMGVDAVTEVVQDV